MGCGASSDTSVSTHTGPRKGPDPFWSLQGDPDYGGNKDQVPRVADNRGHEERKESHKAPKEDHVSTQEQNKDQQTPAGGPSSGTNTSNVTHGVPTASPHPAGDIANEINTRITPPDSPTPAGDKDNEITTRTALPDSPIPPLSTPSASSSQNTSYEENTEAHRRVHTGGTGNEAQTSTAPPDSPTPRTPPFVLSTASTPQQPAMTTSEDNTADQNKRMMKKVDDQNTRETGPTVIKENGPLDSDTITTALLGDIDMTCPSSTKIVRIFTSSTFTDTKNERNMLMKHAYPKVKEHCRRLGYEFQVVDMRWGVRDEATDDHMGTELCLKELKLCQEVSTGPNFVSLLSHKYGYTAFPRVIEMGEFETIMAGVEDEESKQLFQRWYTLDNNAVPPAYILSPISSRLPDFISPDGEKKKQAKQSWWDESEKMQNTLNVTATKVFDKDMARKYIMSVTETEVTEGLLKLENPSKHSLWFKRNIEDIEEQPSSYLLSRYIECTGPEERWQKARGMLQELKEDKMAKKLSADRIMSYSVKWNLASGINPEDKHHQAYLDTLCKDFVTSMTDMIDGGVAERARSDDHLVDECCQHIRFCQSKCEGFQGRQDTLELIKAYVQDSSSEPLVLHGTSGTGKTSIMAMAAKMVKQWTDNTPAVVLRFLGTSPDSSSIIPLLESVTSQILRIYKKPPLPPNISDLDIRIIEFEKALKMGHPDKPLVLMLDSLDQLDLAYDARKLGWLIMKLAPGTKVIVSTLPEPIYECFPALQARLQSESSFVSVPVLDNSDVKNILDSWLITRQRRLTDHQMTTVLDAFKKCPTPLFFKLSFEEAVTWSSFVPTDKTIVQDTVRASIDFLFQKLEKAHGQLLVSRALGYLTIANNGATEAELEDILSCDDDVLNDVYMYWTPPIRRLPPLLIVRIRTDLSQYLVERGTDGVRVIYWYHRQFIEAAEARYCSDKATNRLIHERLADFFNGTWAAGKKKPYTNAKGESGDEGRHVSLQPLKLGPDNYNLRTLNNLPYHRTKAGQVELLKDQCLANPTFLIHKLEVAPFYSVLRDYVMAREMFPDDDPIKEVLQALNLSEKALTTDARQIVPQMLQRLEESNVTEQLLERCREYPSTYILPTKCVLERSGGQLVQSISAHRRNISGFGMTTDGKLLFTASWSDDKVVIWEVEGMKKRREVKDLNQLDGTCFCNHDKWLAIGLRQQLIIQTVDTGVNVMTFPVMKLLDGVPAFCPLGRGRTFIMQQLHQEYKLTNLLADPSEDSPLQSLPDNLKFSGRCADSDNHLAVILDYFFISVYDLNAGKFRPHFRGFPDNPDGENAEIDDVVISRDESHLIYTSGLHSEVVFADFDGHRLRTIPPDEKRWYSTVDLTTDGNYLYIADQRLLRFFDTGTLKEVGAIESPRDVRLAITHDAVNVITAHEDGIIRVWDRSRTDSSKDDKSAEFTTKLHKFDCVQVLNNPRYVLLCGSVEDVSSNLHLEVHDVFTNTSVRHGEITGGTDEERLICNEVFTTKNERHVILVLCERQIVRVDLHTMTVVKNYVGFTTMVAMSEETEEIFCTTRGAMHMKLYDKNGDFVTVMKVGQKQRIVKTHMNATGTFGCAYEDEGSLMLYDIANRTHLYNIAPGIYENNRFGATFAEAQLINRTGTRLVFSSSSRLPGSYLRRNDLNHMVLWDIPERKELCRLYDAKTQATYEASWARQSVALEEMYELNSTRIISTHYGDHTLRVWNIHTGELLAQMRGHASNCYVSLCEKSPYICSYSNSAEEGCVRLWDKTNYQCAASFTFDKQVSNVAWSVDGRFLTSSTWHDSLDVTMWTVYRGYDHMTVEDKEYPMIFPQNGETTEIMNVKLYTYKKRNIEGDPDSDREEVYECDKGSDEDSDIDDANDDDADKDSDIDNAK